MKGVGAGALVTNSFRLWRLVGRGGATRFRAGLRQRPMRWAASLVRHDGAARDAVPQPEPVELGLDGVFAAVVGAGQLLDAAAGLEARLQFAGLAIVPACP